MTRDEVIRYWIEAAEENFASSQNMYDSGEYMWALFVGHLTLEKLLKANYVKTTDINVPRTHDLYKLAIRGGLELSEKHKDDLQYITLFNIEARYEEYKKEFSKKCTKNFACKNLKKIKELRKWLLERI